MNRSARIENLKPIPVAAEAVQRIYLKPCLTRPELLRLEGERPTGAHFDLVVDRPIDAYDSEDGRLLFRFRRGNVALEILDLAKSIFGDIDTRLRRSYYRKSAAGRIDLERVRRARPDVVAIDTVGPDAFSGRFVLESGTRLRDPMSNPVLSFMAGFNYNRYKKRGAPTGFSARFPDEWRNSIPFFDSIGDAFDLAMPDVSKHMHDWCLSHNVMPRFTIGRSCLSTVAINVNYDSCYHFDRGDLPSGYSTLTAIAVGGEYSGGELVLPQYRVAIDVRDGDLLCSQSHLDMHGNMGIVPLFPGAKRISFVTYLKKMLKHAILEH